MGPCVGVVGGRVDEQSVADLEEVLNRMGDGVPRSFLVGFDSPHWTPAEEKVVRSVLGRVPAKALVIAAGRNRPDDHRILAEVAAHLADTWGGWVNLEMDQPPPPEVAPVGRWVAVGETESYVELLLAPAVLRAWSARRGFRVVK